MAQFDKNDSQPPIKASEPQLQSPPIKQQQLRRPNFLVEPSEGGGGGHFFELSRSMSAPPAEFLSSIQSVMIIFEILLFFDNLIQCPFVCVCVYVSASVFLVN